MLPGSEVITRVACAIARSDAPCGGFSSVEGGDIVELSELGSKSSPTAAKCGATDGRAENVLSAGEEPPEDFVSSMGALMDDPAIYFGFGFVVDEDEASGLCMEIPNASRTLLPDFLRGRRFGTGGVVEGCECGEESLDGCCPGVSLTGTVVSTRWCLGFPFCHHVPIQSPIEVEVLSCLA